MWNISCEGSILDSTHIGPCKYFLSACTQRVQAETESEFGLFVGRWVDMSAVISSSSSSPSSLEEGSSQTCVGAVPRDLSLYDILSGIRWLLLHSNTVCCTILSVERCSLGNTSLHRDKMAPPLQEYSSAQNDKPHYIGDVAVCLSSPGSRSCCEPIRHQYFLFPVLTEAQWGPFMQGCIFLVEV